MYLTIATFASVVTSFLAVAFDSDIMKIMSFVAMIAEVILVFMLRNYNGYFKKAFVLTIISFVVSFSIPYSGLAIFFVFFFFLFFSTLVPSLSSILSFILMITFLVLGCAGVIIELVAAYYMFRGHSGILMDIDDALMTKWKKLFVFHMIVTIIIAVYIIAIFLFSTDTFFNFFFVAIEPNLSTTPHSQIIMIGLLVVKCFESYYLYKTHKVLVKKTKQTSREE